MPEPQYRTKTPGLEYFKFAHLPLHLQKVSRLIAELAHVLEAELPPGPQKTLGMQKLIEAKDCFVRATLPAENPYPTKAWEHPLWQAWNDNALEIRLDDGTWHHYPAWTSAPAFIKPAAYYRRKASE